MQGGYNGYNNYRPGYGGQNYAGSGMGGGGAYRGSRGAGDAGQMNNQNNPLWAAQGFPVTGPGGSVLFLVTVTTNSCICDSAKLLACSMQSIPLQHLRCLSRVHELQNAFLQVDAI